jgi:hypothetical protein
LNIPGELLVTYIYRDIFYISDTDFDLCLSASQILNTENAGGNSTVSETLSMECLARLFDASEGITEMDVIYWNQRWKKIDYICTIYNERVGVSVTRAMKHPFPDEFTFEDAIDLLYKKIYGLIIARQGVTQKQQYFKTILHIWCQTTYIANTVHNAFQSLSDDLMTENIIIYTTITNYKPIYYDDITCFT